jgi:hypothetical protein
MKQELQLAKANQDVLSPVDILTPEQLADRLQVAVSWVYEKTREGGKHGGKPLPVLRVGRYLRFSWPDIVEWMRNGNGSR